MNASRNSRRSISSRRINAAGKMIGARNHAEHEGGEYYENSPKRHRKVARQRLTNAVNHAAGHVGMYADYSHIWTQHTGKISIISQEMDGKNWTPCSTKAEVIAALNKPGARRHNGLDVHGRIGDQQISGEMSRGDILRLLANV
jgi:hypothetical protein